MKNIEKAGKITIGQALGELAFKEQIIRMGPTDSEIDQIENIRRDLKEKKITPEKAIEGVQRIEQERSSHYR
ncbi:hypothetical protein COB18_01805 [Candidatus Kaiserbacteria bacterium]|nr:MAG: hypothetical protein COB18_01805 [Candidatus Kaiserbacteria bacterium]